MLWNVSHTTICCLYSKSLECAKLLLDAGVDVNCRNAKDNTPLMVAAALGHYSILKFFIAQANIDINAQVHVTFEFVIMQNIFSQLVTEPKLSMP